MDVRKPLTPIPSSSIHAGLRADDLSLRIAPVRRRRPKCLIRNRLHAIFLTERHYLLTPIALFPRAERGTHCGNAVWRRRWVRGPAGEGGGMACGARCAAAFAQRREAARSFGAGRAVGAAAAGVGWFAAAGARAAGYSIQHAVR